MKKSTNLFEQLTKSQQEAYLAIAIPGFELPIKKYGFLFHRHKAAIDHLIQKNIITLVPENHHQFKELLEGDFLSNVDDTWYCLTHQGEMVFWDTLKSKDFIGHKFNYMETEESKQETEALTEALRPLLNMVKCGQVKLDHVATSIWNIANETIGQTPNAHQEVQ